MSKTKKFDEEIELDHIRTQYYLLLEPQDNIQKESEESLEYRDLIVDGKRIRRIFSPWSYGLSEQFSKKHYGDYTNKLKKSSSESSTDSQDLSECSSSSNNSPICYQYAVDQIESHPFNMKQSQQTSKQLVESTNVEQKINTDVNIKEAKNTNNRRVTAPKLYLNLHLDKPLRAPINHLVMISYVSIEAFNYAVQLKQALYEISISAYLDSNQLFPGCDWQTSLMDGIKNCHVFVPVITKSYGDTLWTAREFKLADCLGKHIVPINFRDGCWPPQSLAIQLSTTQFINCFPRKLHDKYYSELSSMYKFHDVPYYDLEKISISPRISKKWPKHFLNETANQIKLSMIRKFGFQDDFLEENMVSLIETPSSSSNSPSINSTIEPLVKRKKIDDSEGLKLREKICRALALF